MSPSATPSIRTSEALEALVAAGHTVRDLEDALGLSRGYLSKVRHGAARPSPHLVALLEVLRRHPSTLATVRAATGLSPATATPLKPKRPARSRSAMQALRRLAPALAEAGIQWALGGDAALMLLCPGVPERPGVDLIIDERDRRILGLLRARGVALAHHGPDLAIGRSGSADPDDNLRIHFPKRPPLAGAAERAVSRAGLPVVDLTTLTLANLLSRRVGAEEAAVAGLAGGASWVELAARLEDLAALPTPRSPYVLRTFDVELARRRLGSRG